MRWNNMSFDQKRQLKNMVLKHIDFLLFLLSQAFNPLNLRGNLLSNNELLFYSMKELLDLSNLSILLHCHYHFEALNLEYMDFLKI